MYYIETYSLWLQASRLRIEGLPNDTELNPYVKAFLVPGKSFKYRTKTIPKTKVGWVFFQLPMKPNRMIYRTLRVSILLFIVINVILMFVSFISNLQNPAFFEKFIINDIVPSDINDETVLEFQVYSSHHVTRRHLVGVASISLRTIETLENGLVDLTIMPQTVFRVSMRKQANTMYKNVENDQYWFLKWNYKSISPIGLYNA